MDVGVRGRDGWGPLGLGRMDGFPSVATKTQIKTRSKIKTIAKATATTHEPPEGLPGFRQCCLESRAEAPAPRQDLQVHFGE